MSQTIKGKAAKELGAEKQKQIYLALFFQRVLIKWTLHTPFLVLLVVQQAFALVESEQTGLLLIG